MTTAIQAPTIITDTRQIRIIAGDIDLSTFGGTGATADSNNSIVNAPHIILPYDIARASATVTAMVEAAADMAKALGGEGGGSGGDNGFASGFPGGLQIDGLDLSGAAATGDEGEAQKKKREEDAYHDVYVAIDGPLAPTQQVLNVISEYLQMNHRRSFTEVPKPVREPVLETLREDEARFLKDKILNVDEEGQPLGTTKGFAAGIFKTMMSAFGASTNQQSAKGNAATSTASASASMNVNVSVNGANTPSAASDASLSATRGPLGALPDNGPLGGGYNQGGPSDTASQLASSTRTQQGSSSASKLGGTTGGVAPNAAVGYADAAASNNHLFKLRVLRAAIFLQLGPLAAAISGWFAWEMTKLVNTETKATKNAEKLRQFLGVEEDFNAEEKEIIERHTEWPGRS